MSDLTASQPDALTGLVLDALDDLKAVDPVVIDVKALSSVMDFLVLASCRVLGIGVAVKVKI